MRVLFVNRMASMVRGGGETFDLEMARHLEQLDCETSFLSGIPLWGRATSPLDHPRSHVLRSPYTGSLPWDRIWQAWRLRVWDFRRFENRAADWICARQDRYDLVQICEMPPLIHDLQRRGCRLPVSIRITAPDYHDPNQALRDADLVFASGVSIQQLRAGARPDAADIPNGVDVEAFRPQASDFRQRRGIPDSAFVVLMVARYQVVKNHDLALRAVARACEALGDFRLVLVGSGPLQQAVRRQARALGIEDRILFLGEVAFAELPGVYAASDLKLIPSHSESFCFAALEAMATALPLVVTATEWVPNLIGHERGGVVVPLGDAEAMAEAMLALQADPERRRQLGKNNRQTVLDRYQWSTSAASLKALYQELLAPQKRS